MSLVVDFIKQAEGLSLKAYRDDTGVWTIGYGHTGPKIYGGEEITAERAEQLLERDIAWATDTVRRAVRVTLTEKQRAALISLTYNIGSAGFRSSTVLRRLNAGNYEGAADAILKWNKSTRNGVKERSQGLVNRRERERMLFLRDTVPPTPVASTGVAITGGEAKSLIKSKTQWWAGLGLTGVLANVLASFSSIKLVVPEVILTVGPLFLLGAIFIAIMVNRLIDSRKGIH